MARTNKYTSLNFNDIYEKKTTSTSSRPHSSSPSSSNKTVISNSRIHGHMLVLSRPTPKQPVQPVQQQQPKLPGPPPATAESDSISLRPQGRTGSGPTTTFSSSAPGLQSPLPKPNRFVPPHLRPGFVGREEKPVQDNNNTNNIGPNRQGHVGSYGENGRPKSGGGYERMRRGFGEADPVDFVNRPGSSGPRPSSSG